MNDRRDIPLDLALQSLALQSRARTPLPILAGGTDFYPALGESAAPASVLDVTRVAGLRGIDRTDSGWRIGAASTWSDLIAADLPALFDGLKAAARDVGSVQIQNAATLAGNLCNASPAADGVPALLTLDASVELVSVRGRRHLPLAEFITGSRTTLRQPDELLVAVHVPHAGADAHSVFAKLGARRYLVISIVMASITLVPDGQGRLQDARIAVGACSPVARRLGALEDALRGQGINDDLLSLVRSDMFSVLSPIDDVRGSGDYRLGAAQQLVRRLLVTCLHRLPGNQHRLRRQHAAPLPADVLPASRTAARPAARTQESDEQDSGSTT